MKYAYKIDLPDSLINAIKVGVKVTTYANMFDIYKAENVEEILSNLPEGLRNKKAGIYMIYVDFEKGLKEIRAHKHLKEKCVLNFYLQTNGERTIFYEGEEIDVDPATDPEDQSNRTFQSLDMDFLQEAESFVAKNNEAWILRTDQVHSVFPSGTNSIRQVLQIYFLEHDYDEIIQSLGVTSNSVACGDLR